MVKNRFKKIMKRSFGIVLAVMICMSLFAGTAMAADIEGTTTAETVAVESAEPESAAIETIESVSEAEETTEESAEAEETAEETTAVEVSAEESEETSSTSEETEAIAESEENTSRLDEITEAETTEAVAETETTAETEAAVEVPEETTEASTEETKEAEPVDIYACDRDPADFAGVDLSSMRLIVVTGDAGIFVDDSVIISSFGDVYLLQFSDVETARKAYCYYLDKAVIVEADSAISACEGEGTPRNT